MDYSFPDPTTLSEDQQLLWWFDEYLRHDLVFVNGEYVYLIERYDLYNLPYADNYSYYLWLLAQKYNLTSGSLVDNFRVTIPPTDTPITFTITYLTGDSYRSENNFFIQYMKYRREDYGYVNPSIRVIKKHHRTVTTKSSSFSLDIAANIYSIVVNCEDAVLKTQLENSLPSTALYKNINDFEDTAIELLQPVAEIYERFIEAITPEFNVTVATDKPYSGLGFTYDPYFNYFDYNTHNIDESLYHNRPIYAREARYSGLEMVTMGYGSPEPPSYYTPFYYRLVYNYVNEGYLADIWYRESLPERLGAIIFKEDGLQQRFYSTDRKYPYSDFAHIRLVYANPPDTSYNGLFKDQKTQYNYNNLTFGEVEYRNSLHALWYNSTLKFYDLVGNIEYEILSQEIVRTEELFRIFSEPIPDWPPTTPIYQQVSFYNAGGYRGSYPEFLGYYWLEPFDVEPYNPKYRREDYGTATRTKYKVKVTVSYRQPTREEWLETVREDVRGASDVTFSNLMAMVTKRINQTKAIPNALANPEKILLVNAEGHPIDGNGNLVFNGKDYRYITNNDYIKEYVMGMELMVQEIHACLGASEYAYYIDDKGVERPFYMSVARRLEWLAKAYGVAFKPDGQIISTRQRVVVPIKPDGTFTIPDGWTLGQFADNKGGNTEPSNGQVGGIPEEDYMGVVYKQRCNQYRNFDDNDPDNNVLSAGHAVLCDNMLQYIESYLEDLDQALNWQEMGNAVLPSADGGSYCTINGMGTLLAEVAYMLSQLSSNIYQTHNLAIQTHHEVLEILKATGLPLEMTAMPIKTGETNEVGNPIIGQLPLVSLARDTVTLHKRLMDIIANIAVYNSHHISTFTPDDTTTGGVV